MYICENCNHTFEVPEYNYLTKESENVTRIHQSTDSDFSVMEYAHNETSWISCPECGSDMVIDKEDLE